MKKIIIEDIEFPQTLRDIEKPPKQLYYEGNINLLKQKSILLTKRYQHEKINFYLDHLICRIFTHRMLF